MIAYGGTSRKNNKDGYKFKKMAFQFESNIQSKQWADALMFHVYAGISTSV